LIHFLKCFLPISVSSKSTINQSMAQQNEDRYGNEIKRRRMDDAGKHLKVWRVCEFKYALKGQVPAFNEEEFQHQQEEDNQEVNQEVHQEEVHQVVAQFAALAISEDEVQVPEVAAVQEVQDPVPTQVLGRTIIIYTADNQTVRGVIQNLFDLNGERTIQIQTSAGENLIFTSSQMVGLEVLLNPNDEEQLSPIHHDVHPEVIQIDDEDEVIQIDDADDAINADQYQDDFPDVEFQAARPAARQAARPAARRSEQQNQEQDCCAICLDMTDAARNFVSLDCGHQFHFACIMGNMANGGQNRNQCPMCRGAVVQQYDVHSQESMDEMVERLARNNQHLQDELDLNRQHREDLTEEYVRVMTMNMQIGMRHQEERAARDALERRAYMCGLNERIAAVVLSAANNDISQNYEHGIVRMHIERQVRDLCMCFGMMAYDAQYDDPQDQDQYQEDQDQQQEDQDPQQEDLMNHEIIEVD
jgi:hypothetical protein